VLNPITKWRHAVVALSALLTPLVVLMGLAGDGYWPERFDAKQVVVTAVGDGVRIREVVDQDFGTTSRHGYERIIPNDFGQPIDVVASSPDAPADLDVTSFGVETRIRIGDPGTLITGQHRYVLEYTLPAARLDTGTFNLDVIGAGEEFETGRFEVIVTGLELDDPSCATGALGEVDGCTLAAEGDVYRTVIEPLPAGDGITVAGTVVGTREAVEVPLPDLPVRRDAARLPMALGCLALGVLGGIGSYELMRTRGRNVVGGSSAVDAAFAASGPQPRLIPVVLGHHLLAERAHLVTVGVGGADGLRRVQHRDRRHLAARQPRLVGQRIRRHKLVSHAAIGLQVRVHAHLGQRHPAGQKAGVRVHAALGIEL